MNEIKNNIQLLVKSWFNDRRQGIENNTILMIGVIDNIRTRGYIKEKIKNNQFLDIVNEPIEFNYFVKTNNQKNLIFLSKFNSSRDLIDLSYLFEKSIIYIKELDFLEIDLDNFYDFILSNDFDFHTSDRYKYYIEIVSLFKDDLFNIDFNFFEFLNYRLKNQLNTIVDFDLYTVLLNNTTYEVENFFDVLKGDILMLTKDRLLTSRLAIVLFRVCHLDFKATTTKIGRYFSKNIGSKSRVFNYNNSRISFKHSDLNGKNFKAYDLNIDEREDNIRIEIALELLRLNIKKLDANIIAKVTKLPISVINKL